MTVCDWVNGTLRAGQVMFIGLLACSLPDPAIQRTLSGFSCVPESLHLPRLPPPPSSILYCPSSAQSICLFLVSITSSVIPSRFQLVATRLYLEYWFWNHLSPHIYSLWTIRSPWLGKLLAPGEPRPLPPNRKSMSWVFTLGTVVC
jgi:hypothetical protein